MDDLRTNPMGDSRIESNGRGYRLFNPPVERGYTNAQLDDYSGRSRRDFPWDPPLSLEVQARASHPTPVGTLGFGFWNDPFAFGIGAAGISRVLPASPQAAWFFYSSPDGHLAWEEGNPGHGWKAVSLSFAPFPPLIFAVGLGLAFPLTYLPGLRSWIVRSAYALVSAAETPLPHSLDTWHHYRLDWGLQEIRFSIDDEIVLQTSVVPRAPLGFVTWIDNQFAIFSNQKGIRFGTIPLVASQYLDLEELVISRL